MKTRCKFQVHQVTKFAGSQEQITLNAVSGEVPDGINFSKWTPSGKLEFTVTNPEVVGKFEPGTYYYIDLISVE